jgi:transposase-like protein
MCPSRPATSADRARSQKAHFWLTSGAITLTELQIGAMTEDEACLYLAEQRWGSKDKQICPDCGAVDSHYHYPARKQWRCKKCSRTFSVTSGTPFHRQRIGYRKLLMAMFAFISHQKGLPALELRRIIGAHYETCFLLLQKLRAAIELTADQDMLSGTVDIDGAHFSGRRRKPARKKGAPTREQQTEVPTKHSKKGRQLRARDRADFFPFHRNRRIVMVMREVSQEPTARIDYRNGKAIGKGALRTIVQICRSENQEDCEALVERYVQKGSIVRTDEWNAYGNLPDLGFTRLRVNHSVEFCSPEGYNQNQAESFFSRMRRSVIGIHHRITPKYMAAYAWEMAWREDVRRMDTRRQLNDLLGRVFRCTILPEWTNYCRGNHPTREHLFMAPPRLAA